MAGGPEAFQRDNWDSTPLLTRAALLPHPFTDLLSSADVDGLVAERGLRQPFFRLVQDAVPVAGVTRSAVAGSRTITDLADADAVATAYAGGATLVLQSLHRTWPAVGRLCQALAAELGHQTQCNAYVTPAGNAQGFAFHHDTHDVFVLQVEGRKRWQVHAPVLPLPTKSQPRSGGHLVPAGQPPLLDTVLEPGDTLYLPRGFVHAAETTDSPSIHLTIGVIALTVLDILRDVVTSLGPDELALRRALPLAGVAPVDGPLAAAEVLKLAADWISGLDPDRVGSLVDRRFATATAPEPLGMMAQAATAAAVGGDSLLRPRVGLRTRVTVLGDRVRISVGGRRVELPAIAERLVRRALAGPATPAALVEGDPGCDLDDALVVVRRLVREGVLVAGG